MASLLDITDDPDDERSRLQKEHDKKEINYLKTVMRNPKLAHLFKALKNQFDSSLSKIAINKNSSGTYIMDNFTPLEILKMFNGLEIHYIQKAFKQLENLSYDAFIIFSLRILGIKHDEAPYAILGLTNLFNSLVVKQNKKKLFFQDFLNSFLKIQSLSNENRIFVDDAVSRPRFANSSNHDKFHHDNPIKNAFFSVSSQLMFCLDEVSDHLRIYDSEANLLKKIMPDKIKHLHNGDVFIDFAWAENIKTIAAIYQDSRIGFFYESDKFAMEDVYVTKTLQYRIWYIPFAKFFVSCDTFNKLYLWDDTTKEQVELMTFPFKISDVHGLEVFNVIAIATFDRKITLLELRQKMIFMVINLEESSAHTIKYSPNQNVLFVASFDKTVKIYNIDIAKDYTLRGRLEHPSSVTAMELCDNENMVITCDDKGHLKTWDTRSFRNVQSSKLQTTNHPNKIVHLSGSTRFCVLTNRLHFYAFTDNKNLKYAQIQTVPQIIFDQGNEELYIGTARDIRVFDMKYGVLSALYDHEMYNIKNRIVYLQRSKKYDKVFFGDEFGEFKMLEYYNTYKKLEEIKKSSVSTGMPKIRKFQPFECENTNLFFDDRNDLLTTWRDNNLYIYRVEEGNQFTLIRSLNLPQDCTITSAKLFRSEWLIGTIINNNYIMFWEYKKMQLKGIFIIEQNPDDLKEEDPKAKKGRTRYTRAGIQYEKKLSRKNSGMNMNPNTTTPKNQPTKFSVLSTSKFDGKSDLFSSPKPEFHTPRVEPASIQRSDTSNTINLGITSKSNLIIGGSTKREDMWINLMNSAKNEEVDHSENNTPRHDNKEYKFFAIRDITDLVFIRASTAMIVLDDNSEISLVQQDRFESFKSKIRLKLEGRNSSVNYEIIKLQVKTINISKMVSEKTIDPDSMKLFSGHSRSDPIEYLTIIADTDFKITVFNLKETLVMNGLATDIHDNTIVNPHYQATITMDKAFHDSLFNKARKQNTHYDNNDEWTIPASKCVKWKAHTGPILNFKLLNYNGLMLVTISEDSTLKIWTLEGVQLCNLFLNDLRKTLWNIRQETDAKRKYTFEKLKEKVSKIYTKFEDEIDIGSKFKNITVNDSKEEEEIEKAVGTEEDPIFSSKTKKEYINFMAKHLLERDKDILSEGNFTVRPGQSNETPAHYYFKQSHVEKKGSVFNSETYRSGYTTKLAQKLEDIVKKNPDKSPHPDFNIRSFRGSKFGPEINVKLLAEKQKAEPAHVVVAKTSVKMPDIYIPKTKDYQEYFKTSENNSSKNLFSEMDSTLTPNMLSTSRYETSDRGKFRKNILVNLEAQRKLSKNAKSSVYHIMPSQNGKILNNSNSEKTLIPTEFNNTFDSRESYYSRKNLPTLDELKKIGIQTIKSQTEDKIILDRAGQKLDEIGKNKKRYKILDSLEAKRFNLMDDIKYMPQMDAELENKLSSLQVMISHLQPTETLAELNKQIEDLRKGRKRKIQKRLESVTYIPD